MKPVVVTDRVTLGEGRLALIGGPCAIEGRDATLRLAEQISGICERLDIAYVFKASYDKANRSSVDGFRGVGRAEGLSILAEVKRQFNLPVITDVHESNQVAEVAEIADILQIPAFLCRQTELLVAAARSGRVVNVKKGQFLSPSEMSNVTTKLIRAGADRILVTERGTSFGYNNLVVDFRGVEVLRELGWPVVFDATHSVQTPGGLGDRSGGQRQYVPVLARAAVAVGIDALFMEIHEDPDHALSDGPNMVPVAALETLLAQLLLLHELRQSTEAVVLAPYAP